MISSYQTYTFYTQDTNETLRRTAQDPVVAREAKYYRETIGTIKTVDEFLANDRIYNYAMQAYGLEEMAYAKAFIRKVLESDLTDTNSFANRLQDAKYKALAAAYDFGNTKTAEIVQTDTQINALIDTYEATIENKDAVIRQESAHYSAVSATFTEVDDLFKNTRARDFVFSAFGIDPKTFDYQTIRSVLTSDIADPASYVNAELGPKVDFWNAQITELQAQRTTPGLPKAEVDKINYLIAQYSKSIATVASYFELAASFNFNPDGSLGAGVQAQDDIQLAFVKEKYIFSQPRLSATGALLNKQYYEETIGSIATIDDLLNNDRLKTMVLKAFDLPLTSLRATLEWALQQDTSDPASPIFNEKKELVALAKAFNFQSDGTLPAGTPAQDATQLTETMAYYIANHDNADEKSDAEAVAKYKLYIGLTRNLDDFLSGASAAVQVREFALKAFNISPDEVSTFKLKQIFTSDPFDPNSYVNRMKDERFVKLAKAFNFAADGSIGSPRYAQTENEITRISKAYYVAVTRLDSSESAKKRAEDEVSYYRSRLQTLETVDDLVADVRLKNVLLVAEGLRPVDVSNETLKKVLTSNLDDPQSFANQQSDIRLQKVAGAFNFDETGKIQSAKATGAQNDRGLVETQRLFLTQTIELSAGEESIGARLALYFERMAPTITSTYELLADEALAQFIRTSFSIPDEVAGSDIDVQKDLFERYLDINDLIDPEKVETMVQRFLALYDVNSAAQDPLVSLFSGGVGVNFETVAILSQLRASSRG